MERLPFPSVVATHAWTTFILVHCASAVSSAIEPISSHSSTTSSQFQLLPGAATTSSVSFSSQRNSPSKFVSSILGDDDDLCSVLYFGASGNGVDLDTFAIQNTIDACYHLRHNGVVYFPPGHYLTGTVFLRSNVTLRIDPGATILGSPRQQDYPTERDRWYVILAEDAENVEVMGGGTINGQGIKFVSSFNERKNAMVSWNETGACVGDECRPRLLGFLNCKNVLVRDVELRDPAYWCLNIVTSENTLVENVRILGNFNSPNNDGIDIDGSNNTVIRGCHIDTGDDAICPKTMNGSLFNLTVSDIWIRTKSCAVKVGSESVFEFSGLHFERLKIVDSHRGLGLQLRDSGKVSNVTFANIEISTRYYDSLWWGRAEPIYVTACPRHPETVVGSITDLRFVNISSISENGIFLAGSQESTLSNIFFQNVSLFYKDTILPDEGTLYHDYRPGCQGLIPHASSGLFIEHVSDISFVDVSFIWDSNVSWNLPFEFSPTTVGRLSLFNFTTLANSARKDLCVN